MQVACLALENEQVLSPTHSQDYARYKAAAFSISLITYHLPIDNILDVFGTSAVHSSAHSGIILQSKEAPPVMFAPESFAASKAGSLVTHQASGSADVSCATAGSISATQSAGACTKASGQLEGLYAGQPASTALYGNHRCNAMQRLQQDVSDNNMATAAPRTHIKSADAICQQQQCSYYSHAVESTTHLSNDSFCSLDCSEDLQDMFFVPFTRQLSSSGSSAAVQGVPAQQSSNPYACTLPCTSSNPVAAHHWMELGNCNGPESYMQLCNNLAGAAAVDCTPTMKRVCSTGVGKSAAVPAGSASVRGRLLVTERSVYPAECCSSLMALDQANKIMASITLPGVLWFWVGTPSVSSCK